MSKTVEITTPNTIKLSHKKWRALQKREKRRAKRQQEAKERDGQQPLDETANEVETDGEEEARLQQANELERKRVHEEWLRKDKESHTLWLAQQDRQAKEILQRQEDEKRIREEWQEREKRDKEEREAKEKKEKEKKDHQEALLKEATSKENQGDGAWHNPLAPSTYSTGAKEGKEREACSFFVKTGACRFGDRCSRSHNYPESSCTLLLPGMYANFLLEQSLVDEYDTDLALEYDEGETYQHFKEFYRDVLPEFKAVGRVVQFKVSRNFEPHLRGNVYVQYAREEDALKALVKFNARYYAGKQITCEFCAVTSWKQAICGLFFQQRCPKGKNCNFLHVFRNPGNEFQDADRDFGTPYMSQRSHRYGNHSARSNRHLSRSRSRSPSRSVRSRRSRSRSPSRRGQSSRSSRRHRSRSPSVERTPRNTRDRDEDRSLSKSKSRHRRSRSNSLDKQRNSRKRSRSPIRDNSVKAKSRSPSKNKSKQDKIVRSRSKSASRSPAKNETKKDKVRSRSKSPNMREMNSRLICVPSTEGGEHSDADISDGESKTEQRHKSHKKKKKKHKKHHKRDKPDDDDGDNVKNSDANNITTNDAGTVPVSSV